MTHIGFCLGEYDSTTCNDCLSHRECLIMYRNDVFDRIRELQEIHIEVCNKIVKIGHNHP
jgi:hypothetical protein